VSATLDPEMVRQMVDAHAVYRMFASDGRLLYVGRTGDARVRFGDHGAKRWFVLVHTITLEWHATEAAAAAAETAAIRTERPRYNIRGVDPRKPKPERKPWQPVIKVKLPAATVALPDVISVFEGERHLHWQTIAARLTQRYPNRWAGATGVLVSAQIRNLGVPGVHVREPGNGVRHGCRLADLEAAGARRILAA